jgi:mannose-6-phosphate isomerase-like protein (cupin superfamily)
LVPIIRREDVEPLEDHDGAVIRELAAPSNSALERLSVAEIVVKAGQQTSGHHHQHLEEVYCILEGTGVMCMEGMEQPVGPGDTVIILPGTTHELRNTGTQDLMMVVVCSPPFSLEDSHPD